VEIRALADAAAVAEAGAAFIADSSRSAVETRGAFTLAVSGGQTPRLMLRKLGRQDLPWPRVRVVQVDERVAPAASPDRNLTHLRETLLANSPLPPGNLFPMPVEDSDLVAAASRYARTVEALGGSPPVLDLIHLGLGADGHTASLVPGDPVLELTDCWVGITAPYQRHRRMTLTYPVLDRARSILFVVTGSDKAEALLRLSRRDRSCPAGRIANGNILVLADRAAASRLDTAG
jgi:6-phosphogluconolactonase